MIESSPKVDVAFQQLTAVLAAEVAEYRKVGGNIFHGGAPRQAQALLRRANDHESLHQQIAALERRNRESDAATHARTAYVLSKAGTLANWIDS